MQHMWTALLCATFAFVAHRPPVGAQYSTELSFLVGRQAVHLHIDTRHEAIIRLQGIITQDARVKYKVAQNGSIDFEMPETMQRMLRKYMVRIQKAHYQPDVARIDIFVKPIRFRKRVHLARVV